MSARPRVAVLLPRTHDATTWEARYARGEVRDRYPYGYDRAADRFELSWSVSPPDGPLARRIRSRLYRLLGFDLLHVWQNRTEVFSADLVWTHTEREHLAVALLQRLRPRWRPVPVLAQSVWLWESWTRHSPRRQRFLASLLRMHPIELVHSRLNREVSRDAVPGRTVELAPFGTTVPQRRTPIDEPERMIVAAGNDIDRDWATLAQVASRLPDVTFRVASSSRSARRTSWPDNVTVQAADSVAEMDAIYAAAAVIVVPACPNTHASGATSVIEAFGAGVPTIATAAGGLEDYAGEDARLVDAQDPDQLYDAIGDALGGAVAAPSIGGITARGLTQADYVERYVRVSDWLLHGGDYPSEAFEFAAMPAPPQSGTEGTPA